MFELLLNTANYVPLLIITFSTAGMIAIGRKFVKPSIPALLVIVHLCLLVYHSVTLDNTTPDMQYKITKLYFCLALDFTWILMSFLGYLWIDDIKAKLLNKKSYDDSLSWFWNKL